MLASAQWFFTRIIPQIYHYVHEQADSEVRPIKSFIITGHSLGAGTAALLTMMVADHLEELRRLSGNPDFQVHCYSYAPVASVSLDLSEKYAEYIDSFVCHDDLVARLSYGTASCAKELIMDAMIAVDGMGGTSKINADSKARKACFDIIEARRREIFNSKEPRYPLLYIPGNVYQFRRPDPKPKDGGSGGASGRPRASTSAAASRGPSLKPTSPDEHVSPVTSTSEPSLLRRAASQATLGANQKGTAAADEKGKEEEESSAFTLHRSSPFISEELFISKTCLEDHMLVTYLQAFQAVRQDCMRELSQRHKQSLNNDTSDTQSSATVPSIQIQDPEGKVEPATACLSA